MTGLFVGRRTELAALRKRLDRVNASGSGEAVAIRGRRQVGKSRLVQEFCDLAKVPYLYFTAFKGASPVDAVTNFLAGLRDSSLPPDPTLVPTDGSGSWPDAFRILAAVLPDRPSIVVVDELPWLSEQDEVFDGALQVAWDRHLSSHPLLLLLLGSDLHMMERFAAYDRPFYGRADTMVLRPLNPAETGVALGLGAADAIDAHLASGGLPGIVRSWPYAMPALDFLRQQCADPLSRVFSVPETSLLAEFPASDQARRVLMSIGGGDRTHATIAAKAGSREGALPSGALSPVLHRLVEEKRVVAMDEPLSTRASRPALYRVADSNLRLYLAILRSAQEELYRDRTQAAIRLIERRWTAWRGKAVEPVVREALEGAALDGRLPWDSMEAVGGWWNRQFNPEVDLVGADRAPVARQLFCVGSIKWLSSGFDAHDLGSLMRAAPQVPGFVPGQTGLVVVTKSGLAPDLDPRLIDVVWGPEDVIGAWS